MSRSIRKGAVDQSIVLRFLDATDFSPETGVTDATAGLALWYRREGGLKVAITPAALAALDTAHTDGGVEHISDGYVRVDAPDLAFATGSNGVAFGGSATGMTVIGAYVPLVDYDPQSAANLGVTALTGHTPQTGDSFGRIGATGSGLTSLASQASVNALPTAAANADAVWDELRAGHAVAGSFGVLFDAAISSRSSHAAADVWTSATRTLTDKAGFSLAAAGMDLVITEAGITAGVGLTNDTGTQLTSINHRQAMALVLSACGAVLAGAATTNVTIKPGGKPAGNTRVDATVDGSGNRSAVNLKVPD